ncbi:MAG: PIG-L family deacetylase [Planctomycetaceae bacterium]|nr:PIG-L family deacetylase [Planctomycetaceae bacterium]
MNQTVRCFFTLTLTLALIASAIAQQELPKPYGGTAPDAQIPDDGKVRIINFGAHPDDAEIRAGGTAVLWAERGDQVKFVSTTNGDIGHWKEAGGALALRRYQEAQDAAKVLGIAKSVVWDIHDGELEPTLANRLKFTREIRLWNADIVIAHRPNDYHPDHRYTGILMQDSAYMVGVPFLAPDTPPLLKTPVFLFSHDGFQNPPFRADIVVAIDDSIDKKAAALALMDSQFSEGGALGHLNPRAVAAVADPTLIPAQRERTVERFKSQAEGIANRYRDKLIELYGEEVGRKVKYAEAFEICEYGRRPNRAEILRLFPITPPKSVQ